MVTSIHARRLGFALILLALACERETTGASGGATNGGAAVSGAANVSGTGTPSLGGGGSGGATNGPTGGTESVAGNAGSGGGGGSPTEVCPFTSDEYLLWPAVPPGDKAVTIEEVTTERSQDPSVMDRTITGVTRPSLVPYLAKAPGGAAAIIIPGGGYSYITIDKEGVDIAQWLNSLGVSAFILKYRLPAPFRGSPWVPLADAQRALRTIRSHAEACSLDSERVGVIGFSAGGHLASQLVTRFGAQDAPVSDALDAVDPRPSFAVLMYPVISMDPTIAHVGSRKALLGDTPTADELLLYSSELQVTAATPPTFVATSKKDTAVDPDHSVRFVDALTAASVPAELRLYEDGGHGTGIRNASGDMAAWPSQCAAWLELEQFTP